jgi:uncharacterized C2H2 Zn-finger protein
MIACPNCAARFSANPEIERQWYERHIQRSHGAGRVARVEADNSSTPAAA